ncbi:hypothetical protein N9P53_02600 [Flavobacteriaceae bacterium]|mgnify:FL=1|nr:hypothetical protein [Flavobacteriaceae bacterium]MDA9250604.1 hypothetical protein [Flavobacteriaceae bacterium]
MINKYIFLISVISFAVLSRFLPHPPNFTPVAAIALLSCKGFNNRWIAIIIPMIIMFISDLVLGLHGSIPFVYGAFILISLFGSFVKKINIGVVLSSSVIFFLVSNFGVWFLYYPSTFTDLVTCYTLAIPFFLNTILGDLFFSALMIYSFYYMQKRQIISA